MKRGRADCGGGVKMEVSETSVAEFVELTGATNDTARFHLEAAAGRLDAAVEAYFGMSACVCACVCLFSY